MNELTLEALAKRLEAVEKQLAEQAAQTAMKPARKKDWRRSVGMFTGSEFMKDVDAEGAAIREAEREGQSE